MSIFNTILIIVIFVAAIMGILYYINKNKNAEENIKNTLLKKSIQIKANA